MSSSRRSSWLGFALTSLLLAGGCTHDFTGYHLESDAESGGLGGDSGGGAGSGGARPAHGGASHAGAADRAGASANAGEAGESTAMPDAGAPSRGGSGGTENGGASGGSAGQPGLTPVSCAGLANTCGPDQAHSCCAASVVPGGAYNRSNQATAPATVSAFTLDDYEVTVGRFRNFIAVYTQSMTLAGSGKNPNDFGANPGWSALWNAKLPANSAALRTLLSCSNGTFTAAVGANESKPVTCVNWYEAYAFCIWDGARLPTEAEWNFAAAGGSEERTYPWGATVPDDTFAVFCPGSCNKMLAVGSKQPTGNGKWGHADLVGNAWEWNLDVSAAAYPKSACNDCANAPADSNAVRVFRGGSAGNDASYLLSATRYSRDPSDHNGFVGLRCARNP